MLYFKDSATSAGIHTGFIEHEELELTDEELARLKSRARQAVTMDSEPSERILPLEYTRDFLRERHSSYEAFLRGEQ